MENSYSPIDEADDVLVGVSEAARRLGVTPRTLHRWEQENPPKIEPTRTPGGQRRYSLGEIKRVRNRDKRAGATS